MTKYLVLRKATRLTSSPAEADAWEEEGVFEASSATGAIRLFVEASVDPVGGATFVATPARSWKPQSVVLEQTERLRVGEPRTRAKAETPAGNESPAAEPVPAAFA